MGKLKPQGKIGFYDIRQLGVPLVTAPYSPFFLQPPDQNSSGQNRGDQSVHKDCLGFCCLVIRGQLSVDGIDGYHLLSLGGMPFLRTGGSGV